MDRPKSWQPMNLAAIQQRLAWLQQQPDGIIFCQRFGIQYVVVRKDKYKIKLALVEKVNLHTDLLQSVLDLNNPLHLVSEYTQAMLLGLVWQSQPQRIYIAGFGGGRIPLVLHHYLPETVIECADVDPIAIEAATQCFGVQLDDRLTCDNSRRQRVSGTAKSRYAVRYHHDGRIFWQRLLSAQAGHQRILSTLRKTLVK